ncbi:TolC family protein [Desertivirga xinjiangensis]|uniref:TolC family protein n=1 Tax=Desertivirga xinjiangensis TaxID=539206 RepID=UPI00210DE762|nr:TolC family protein [Pedobacter xinjiangensis]
MRKILLVTLVILSGFDIRAQENPQGRTFQFNLQECLQYAYENQDSIKNAKLDIESANYKVKETIGIGLPQVSGSAQFQDYLKIPTTLIPGDFVGEPGTFVPVKFGVKYQSNAALAVNQLLFNGSYLVGLKASRTYKELSERNYNRTKISTTVSVTKAYYQVLVSNEQIRLLDANVSQLEQQLKETTELNKQGFVEKIDLDRLRVIYNNLLTTRENTERLLVLSTQMLKFQMGMPVTDDLKVKDKISAINMDVNTSIAVDTSAYKNRIEYGLLETQRKLNDLNVQRLKSEYLPTLSAFGNSSYQYQADQFRDLFDQRFPMTVVGLQLNIPIFSGFQRKYQIKQAQVEVKKTDNILNTAKNGILLQQEQARIMYQNGMKSLNNQKANMELAREVLRVSKIKYQEGVGSSIEVTQAQTELEQAENNYIQALYDALVSKVDLDNAYGRIQ